MTPTPNPRHAAFSYAPGTLTAVVVWPIGVLVDRPIDDAQNAQLYAALTQNATPETAMDAMAAQGMANMADFGIIAAYGTDARVVVHGGIVADLADNDDPLTGSGILSEKTVPVPTAPLLRTAAPIENSGNSPIGNGIVPAAWLSLDEVPAAGKPNHADLSARTGDQMPSADKVKRAVGDPAGEAPPPPPPGPVPAPPSLGATQMAPSTMSLASADQPPAQNESRPFIDSFNWAGGAAPVPAPASSVPPPPPDPSSVPPPPPPDFDAHSDGSDLGGHTIRRPVATSTGDIVAAVYCPAGHLNPPFADLCRVCQAPIAPQQPVQVPRPPLGVLKLSNNLVLKLDRGAVLGRNPRVIPGEPGPQPNLVRLNDPNKDISSAHLEVRLEGWYVTVRDLGSTNGTQVILPGHAPVTLRPNEPMTLEPGARVVLAQVFNFVYEAA